TEDLFDFVPDMITCAKGLTSGYLPMGACLISDRVMEMLSHKDAPSAFTNGYTFSAHPVCCAAALKNIEIMENEQVLEHVRAVTPHFQNRLRALMKFDIVGDARGMGLLGCIEGKADDLEAERTLGSKIDAACEEMGLLVRPLINMAVFSPPLIITLEQIDDMFDILERALQQVQDEVLR
ncbi:MAG: putrescine aminotransferase, partial [Paracoccaceae bacterium]